MKWHPIYSRRLLSDAAIQALLNRAEGEWKGLILMGLHTEQRLREIVRLSWKCVDLERNSIRFHVAKTQRTYAVPISAVLRGYLITVPKPSGLGGPVFPQSTRRTLAGLKRQFKGLAAAAGVEAWGFEALRFTCWWRCEVQSLPPDQVMEMTKHESDEVRCCYDQPDISTLKQRLAHFRDAKTGRRPPPPHPKSD
jgi:integrase